jgi:hypothetical protein
MPLSSQRFPAGASIAAAAPRGQHLVALGR